MTLFQKSRRINRRYALPEELTSGQQIMYFLDNKGRTQLFQIHDDEDPITRISHKTAKNSAKYAGISIPSTRKPRTYKQTQRKPRTWVQFRKYHNERKNNSRYKYSGMNDSVAWKQYKIDNKIQPKPKAQGRRKAR